MTATAHILVGGAISAYVKDPGLGISLSALSHPLLDLIPHWDVAWDWRKKPKLKLFSQAFLDVFVGVVVSYIVFATQNSFWYFFACILASIIWDVAESPYWFLNWHFPPFSWIYNVQSRMQGKAKLPWGILTQVLSVGIIILFLQTFKFLI